MKPKVSILIVNYNSGSMLVECVQSLLPTLSIPAEVIIIDNASSDASMEMTEKMFKFQRAIQFIRLKKNLGFGAANNQASKQATGEYLVLLNCDTKVTENWLVELLAVFDQDPTVGAAQSKLKLFGDPDRIDCAGVDMDIFGIPMEKGRHISYCEIDQGQYDQSKEIFSGCAAAFAIKSDIFYFLHGFDEDFFMYLEDVDLSWRLQLAGYKIVFASQSVVFHHRGGTSKKLCAGVRHEFTYHTYKNHLIMLLKNYGWGMFIFTFPFTVFLFLVRFLNKRRSPAWQAVIWNLKNFHFTYGKRKYVQVDIRKISDWNLIKKMKKMPLFFQMR